MKQRIKNKELLECLEIIENNDIEHLCEIAIINDKILFNIISEFCYYSTNNAIRIKNNYIGEEVIDDYIQDKIPDSLKESSAQKKK